MSLVDACIIGGGPAGITAAFYLARSGCSVSLVERLALGGQVLQTATLENYPGFPLGIKGYELADAFSAHLDGTTVNRITDRVVSVSGEAGNFVIRLEEGGECRSRAVLVCCGARHRQLGLDGEERLTGRGVSYCALCDGNFFRGQTVAVVGGGNSALEEALYLANLVGKLHLIHRREEFRGSKIYQDRLIANSEKVCLHRSSIITRLHGDDNLAAITVKNLQTNEEQEIPVEGLFIYVGFEPETSFLPQGMQRDAQGFIVTDTEMRSSIPGIFAAGDIRSKLCRQVVTAAGDGATAAQAIFVFLEQLHA